MLIAGKIMWAEIVNANCSRASTRTSLVSGIRIALRHVAGNEHFCGAIRYRSFESVFVVLALAWA
jgi:hypothetical protein